MSEHHEELVLGGPAPTSAHLTAEKLAGFAVQQWHLNSLDKRGLLYLDVGCGNGFIMSHVASLFDLAVGIDVESGRLREFKRRLTDADRVAVLAMSADSMGFPANRFHCVTAFEVLEHVPNLIGSVKEMIRVCAPGGLITISVPQIGFPFENHGMRIGSRHYERKIPLLPYLRPLHRRASLARIFSSREMDGLFLQGNTTRLIATAYAAPQFERAGANQGSWESKLVFMRSFLNKCESIPLVQNLIGVSMLKTYQKVQ